MRSLSLQDNQPNLENRKNDEQERNCDISNISVCLFIIILAVKTPSNSAFTNSGRPMTQVTHSPAKTVTDTIRTFPDSSSSIPPSSTSKGESKSEIPQKLTQLSPRFHPRHLVGKRTAQKDAIKDTTSDGQVNSCFPYR